MKARNQAYLNAFGEHVRHLMEEANKKPVDIAAHGLIETKQVYRILNGEHDTTLSVIIALAKGLDVEPKDLFNFEFDFGQF